MKIAPGLAGFDVALADGSNFGTAVTNLGDLDGDGHDDLAVGSSNHGLGSVWILWLGAGGIVKQWLEVARDDFPPDSQGFEGVLGTAVTRARDFSEPGFTDLVIIEQAQSIYLSLIHI